MLKYLAFGITIESIVPLPELLETSGSTNVTISYGEVPLNLVDVREKGLRFQAAPGQLLLIVDGVARYLVRKGSSILIERASNASDDDVRLFLLGSVLGALMQQRGMLTLSGSAIDIGGRAVAFIGPNGAGKSTLAAAFHKKGFSILTDDICAVTFDENNAPLVMSSYPEVKLWMDMLRQLGIASEPLRRVRPSLEKRAFPTLESFSSRPCPLHSLYFLNTTNNQELSLNPVLGSEKFKTLKDSTYRRQYIEGLDIHLAHFKQTTALATRVKMMKVVRPSHPFMLDELVELLEEDFGE